MDSFETRIANAAAFLTTYIRKDGEDYLAKYPEEKDLLPNGFLRPIYIRYVKKIKGLIERYLRNPFVFDHCGEDDFHRAFNDFDDLLEKQYMTSYESGIAFLRADDKSSIYFSADSLNLKVNRILLHSLYEKLQDNIRNGKIRRLPAEGKNSEFDLFLLRQLMMVHCIKLSGDIGAAGQFTYAGERLISDGEDKSRDTVQAVPFRHAERLSCISSIRFLEKIDRQIKKKEKDNPSGERKVKIAFFGKPSDTDWETKVVERILKRKHGTDWKICSTVFSLKKLSPFSIEVTGKFEGKTITGNLLDRGFYLTSCKDFDILCLLDSGYLYTDTNKFSDSYGDSPYEAVRSRFSSLEFLAERDGNNVRNIGYRVYDGLYTSVLKWIENQFYGKNHSFAFDPRLFFTLKSLKEDLGQRSLYLFLSRDRGTALSSIKEYRNLCKGEFFEGREIVAFDWSNCGELSIAELERRDSEILSDRYSDKSIIPVRLWKLIKSAGKYYYSKGFVNLFKAAGTINDESIDEYFIEYALKTWVYIDYSGLKEKTIAFGLKHFESSKRQQLYSRIAEAFIASLMRIALDARCFDDCASGFLRNVLFKAMVTDAISLEHLLVARKLWDKNFFTGNMDVFVLDQNKTFSWIEPDLKTESHALYIQHMEDNLSLNEAIASANRSGKKDKDNLQELFRASLPNIEGRDRDKLGSDIVREAQRICEKIDYQECALYKK